MTLARIDWFIVAVYFLLSLGVGLMFTRRASRSTENYFLAGRTVPWWLAGVSIVATTFASDTPLLVTGITARGGIAGNWIWWAFVLSGMLTVFFFARLWRRSGVMTDVEFVAIRYSGRPAHFLRIFRAVYLGLPINAIIGGAVTLGMIKVLKSTTGIDEWTAVLVCIAVTALYSTLGGFMGVLWTDFFQFLLAMAGSVALAVFAVGAVGGLSGLQSGLVQVHGDAATSLLTFFPRTDGAYLPLITLAVFLSVQWWSAVYPGAEPGGGGYVAQRMFASKDEKSSLLAVLSFNILHYTVRPWPWILTGLASMVFYAGNAAVTADPELGYVKMMTNVLPHGWRGVMLAAFGAAYMSTISTQLNWGASYLVNDLYRPYIRKDATEQHYVAISRVASVIIMVLSALVALRLGRVTRALDILLSIGAGTGLVFILRWYWWRVSAWSELSAMVAATATSLILQLAVGPEGLGLGTTGRDSQIFFAYSILITTAVVTVVWLTVTFVTPPTDEQTLVSFFRRTRPSRRGWEHIAALAPEVQVERTGWVPLGQWVLGCLTVYLSLFGIGELLLGGSIRGLLLIAASLLCGWGILHSLRDREAMPPSATPDSSVP
jgi:SSS family transporter